jgi:hypothetical protein
VDGHALVAVARARPRGLARPAPATRNTQHARGGGGAVRLEEFGRFFLSTKGRAQGFFKL